MWCTVNRILGGIAIGLAGAAWGAVARAATPEPPVFREVLVERFEGGEAPSWSLRSTGGRAPCLRLAAPGEPPGLHFVSRGTSSASARWEVGTESFELSFRVEIGYGRQAAWRFPGVCLAVSSAAPGEATEDDVALCWSVHAQGLTASVRTGGLFDGAEKRPGVWHFRDRSRSPRFVLNQGGAGGHDYSVRWPGKRIDGTGLRLRVTRRDGGRVSFAAWHCRRAARPWWTGEWTLPEELAARPLRHVIVKTVLNPSSHAPPHEPIRATDELRGRVHDLEGRLLRGPPAPVVTGFRSAGAVLADGSRLAIDGRDFERGAAILVDGRPASAATFVSSSELLATLGSIESGRVHELRVVQPSGLSGRLPGGLPAGRFVTAVEPREVAPGGGDAVTITGEGFDDEIRVLIGDRPALGIRRVDSTRLVVRVPPGETGAVRVRVRAPDAEFRGAPLLAYAPHPYLWFGPRELAGLRERFRDPRFAHYRQLILRTAEGPADAMGRVGTPSHAALLHGYLWAYLLDRDPRHRERLFTALDVVLRETGSLPANLDGHPGRRRQMLALDEFMIHVGEAVATVYDTLFGELTPAERADLVRYLDAHLDYYLGRIEENDWWYRNNPSNTVAVGNGCGGVIALSLIHGRPEGRQAVDRAVDAIRSRYVAIADDGGCVEGNLYWDYGFTYQLLFGHALRRSTGDDRGLLTAPRYSKTRAFIDAQLGGDGLLFSFNDTQPWLTGIAICADFGSRLDDPLLCWMADRIARAAVEGEPRVFTRPQFYALAFRARDGTPAPDRFPGVPTVVRLPVLNQGALRSDAGYEPALVVGVKGRGGPTTHHTQEDAGSFVLQSRGESFLIDPGYYQGAADAHSLPLVDGHGPDRRGVARISEAWELRDLRTMTVDSTPAYAAAGATRVRRTICLAGEEAVVVVDDVRVSEGRSARVTSWFQCGFPVELSEGGRAATLRGARSSLSIRALGRDLEPTVSGPRDFGRSWVFAETGVRWHRVSLEYPADGREPLVTAFLPHASDRPAPSVELSRADGRRVVRLESGRSIELVESPVGWRLVPPEAR